MLGKSEPVCHSPCQEGKAGHHLQLQLDTPLAREAEGNGCQRCRKWRVIVIHDHEIFHVLPRPLCNSGAVPVGKDNTVHALEELVGTLEREALPNSDLM